MFSVSEKEKVNRVFGCKTQGREFIDQNFIHCSIKIQV